MGIRHVTLTAMSKKSKPLSRSRLIYFGLPDYAVYLASIPVSLYLPFVYSRDLGLGLAEIGFILMLARITDVVTDPLNFKVGDALDHDIFPAF